MTDETQNPKTERPGFITLPIRHGRILAPPPSKAAHSLSPRRRSGERVRERGSQSTSRAQKRTPLPSPLPARASRGEGATQRSRWWWCRDARGHCIVHNSHFTISTFVDNFLP